MFKFIISFHRGGLLEKIGNMNNYVHRLDCREALDLMKDKDSIWKAVEMNFWNQILN